MKRRFQKHDAFKLASPQLVDSVGRAMIVFAKIEGAVNFALLGQVSEWEKISRISVSKRLDLLAKLFARSSLLDPCEIEAIIGLTKKAFKKRNIIAHSPLMSQSGREAAFICSLDGGEQVSLTADDVLQIANEANDLYNEIMQLYWNRHPWPSTRK